MAEKKPQEPKVILEREYIVPLRREWLKVPMHKRANKAAKALKQFLAKHMKIYDRDLRNIKISQEINNEIRFRGMKKPPAKIKVLAKKLDNGIVRAELVDIPVNIKFERLNKEKKKAGLEKKTSEKTEVENPEKKEEMTEDTKEKETSSKEEHLKLAKEQAKERKHVSNEKMAKTNQIIETSKKRNLSR